MHYKADNEKGQLHNLVSQPIFNYHLQDLHELPYSEGKTKEKLVMSMSNSFILNSAL